MIHLKNILFFACLSVFAGCYVSNNPVKEQARMLKRGLVNDDTSYVYALPFEKGKYVRVIQGYFSQFSHRERAAIDFNAKPGHASPRPGMGL